MIQTIADTLNGWATDLHNLAARITAFVVGATDLSPISAAVANISTALDAVKAAVASKEAPPA